MARKQNTQEAVDESVQDESVQDESVQDEAAPVELTEEQVAVKDALAADDHINALQALKIQPGTSEKLATIIATFLALVNALGEDAPATQHALKNLANYQPEKVKVKKERAKKEPAFNAAKELHLILATDSIDALIDFTKDERVPQELAVLVTTYTTLASLEGIDESVVNAAKANLASFGRKGRSGGQTNREAFHIKAGDVVYTTLTGALDANGLHKGDMADIDGKQRDVQDLAWRTVRPKLLSEGSFEYKGVTYEKVEPSADAVQTVRTRAKAEDVADVESDDELGDDE